MPRGKLLDAKNLKFLYAYLDYPNYTRIGKEWGITKQATKDRIDRNMKKLIQVAGIDSDNPDYAAMAYREELMAYVKYLQAQQVGRLGSDAARKKAREHANATESVG